MGAARKVPAHIEHVIQAGLDSKGAASATTFKPDGVFAKLAEKKRAKKARSKAPKAFLEAAKPYHWKKGQSGNPNGLAGKSTKSFSALIREATGDGAVLIETMYDVALNVEGKYGIREQLQAIEYLTSYGFGKPPQEIKLETKNPLASVNMAVLTNEQLLQLTGALDSLRAPADGALLGGSGTPLLEGPSGAGTP